MKPCAVYQITNTVNGRTYIGISVRGARGRWYNHCADAARGSQTCLHRAIRKYGRGAFRIQTLAGLPNTALAKQAERALIARLKPAYNMTPGGDGRQGPLSDNVKAGLRGLKRSPASRARISEGARQRARTPEGRAHLVAAGARAKLNAHQWTDAERAAMSARFKCSDETRERLRQAQTGRVYSEASRAKMSASAKARRRKPSI